MALIKETPTGSWMKPVQASKWKSLTDLWPEGTEYRLWNPRKEVDTSLDIEWHGGIDVHLKGLTVGLYGIDKQQSPERVLGPIISIKVSDMGYQELFEMFDYFVPIRILMETTGVYSFDPYYRCRVAYPPNNGEARVICMNAHDLKMLLVTNKKTDKVDTSRLSFLASVPELLRESYIPTRDEYNLRLMLRQRNKHQGEATKYKSRVKTLLAAGGLRWGYNYRVKGDLMLLKRFIGQKKNIATFLQTLEKEQDLPREIQQTLKKQKKLLMGWASYSTTEQERVNLVLLLGLKDKFEGLVELYDKMIYERLLCLPRFQESIRLIQNIPGMGNWALTTILLETGPISRFPRVGAYLSYAGVTRGVAQSADVNIKMGNNPHSHRILKQAYRTMGISLLGMVIRADKKENGGLFLECHPLIEYARKINQKFIQNGQKANKIAAKCARIVYGILRTKKPYDNAHEEKWTQEQYVWRTKHKLVVRYSAFEKQIKLLKRDYEEIAKESSLAEEPFAKEFINRCKALFKNFERETILGTLKIESKNIRALKKPYKVLCPQKKKTSKKQALKRGSQSQSSKVE